MSKSTAQRLAELRLLYERTVAQVEDSFEARIAKAKKELKDAENFDYTKDFTDRYDASLVSLERLYDNIALTHQATKGIGFRIDRYVTTVQPRTIAKGGVEDHLIMLVKECRSAIAAVSKSVTPEEDIEHLKRFAQGLVDLRYIAKNGRKLILDSGVPQHLKEERVYHAQAALDKVEAEREVALKLQNLACYEELEMFRLATIENAHRAKSRMLGSESETFGDCDDNKFLMGFYTAQIEREDLAFAEEVLELTSDELSIEPIFFELKENHSVILINAKKEFFQDFLFDALISNIYFSFATGMPAKQLQFRAVEAGVSEAVLEGLGALVAANMQDETCQVANDLDGMEKITGVLRDITKMAFARSGIYRMQHVRSIFEYNRKVEENPDKFVFFAINHYPYGFNSTRGIGGKELIKTINDCDTKGLITVVCQATDAEFSDTAPMLTPEILNADCIEIDGENYFYNGHPASLNIRAEGFDIEKYWSKLGKYSKEASSLWLKDVLKQAENRSESIELPSVDKKICIPIGNSGGNFFELVMNTCSRENHGLIVGPTGSGKSAFLHTMILSAASRYSPDELRFCLVDFKSSKDSPEFSQYRKRKGVENLYIPHVDYLLVNGKPECVFDLFGKINAMIRERGALMSQCGAGVGELSVYNESVGVGSDEKPRIPYVFFIIDEYNVMINGGLTDEGVAKNSTTLRSQIVATLSSLARTARAFGIGIILSGQSVAEELAGNGLGQFGTRIALRTKDEGDYAKLEH